MKIKSGLEDEYQKYVALNSGDAYSKGVVDYSEKWADLMEQQLSAGNPLAGIAKQTSHDADTEGITRFMYGFAVLALARFWEHGEELRQWHNLNVQFKDEGEKANASGGVLNPACLTIG